MNSQLPIQSQKNWTIGEDIKLLCLCQKFDRTKDKRRLIAEGLFKSAMECQSRIRCIKRDKSIQAAVWNCAPWTEQKDVELKHLAAGRPKNWQVISAHLAIPAEECEKRWRVLKIFEIWHIARQEAKGNYGDHFVMLDPSSFPFGSFQPASLIGLAAAIDTRSFSPFGNFQPASLIEPRAVIDLPSFSPFGNLPASKDDDLLNLGEDLFFAPDERDNGVGPSYMEVNDKELFLPEFESLITFYLNPADSLQHTAILNPPASATHPLLAPSHGEKPAASQPPLFGHFMLSREGNHSAAPKKASISQRARPQ